VAVCDERHKHSKGKGLLKGLFDTNGTRTKLILTGSSRLDICRRGGDSLIGRYLPYRVHPWSVAECLHLDVPETAVRPPLEIGPQNGGALDAWVISRAVPPA
jgi:predicted AAA+ superfamily ATPase